MNKLIGLLGIVGLGVLAYILFGWWGVAGTTLFVFGVWLFRSKASNETPAKEDRNPERPTP